MASTGTANWKYDLLLGPFDLRVGAEECFFRMQVLAVRGWLFLLGTLRKSCLGIHPLLCFGILSIDRETLGTSILQKAPLVAKDLQLGSTRQRKNKNKIHCRITELPTLEKTFRTIESRHVYNNQVRIVFSPAGQINRASLRNACFYNPEQERLLSFTPVQWFTEKKILHQN